MSRSPPVPCGVSLAFHPSLLAIPDDVATAALEPSRAIVDDELRHRLDEIRERVVVALEPCVDVRVAVAHRIS
jgi:hypothetical protein